MKKILIILTFLIVTSFASQTVKFETIYLPNKKIMKETHVNSDSLVNISGEGELIENLKKQGRKFPTVLKMLQVSKEEIETSDMKDDGSIDIKLKILEKDSYIIKPNNEKQKIQSGSDSLANSTLIIKQSQNGTKTVEKVESDTLSEIEKNDILQIFKSVFLQADKLELNNKEFKLGETYIDTQPISIPANGMIINMKQNTKYTLSEITKDGIAKFDLLATYDMNLDMSAEQANIDANAYGNGVLLYDTKNKMEKLNKFSMNFDMKFYIDSTIMSMKSTMTTKTTSSLID